MADYEEHEVDYEPDDDDLHRGSVQPGLGDSETEDEEEEVGPAPPAKASPKRDESPPKRDDSHDSKGELHDKAIKITKSTTTVNALASAGALSSRNDRPMKQENTGVYIPPARRKLLEEQQIEVGGTKKIETSTIQSQRASWEHLKRTINGTINRLSPSTIKPLIHDLFTNANLLRGRGILARSILRASQASPQYANIYAALAAVVNTKLPEVGELLLTRAILAFRRGYKTKDRNGVSSSLALLGHLFNQGMAQELLSLQVITVLLDGDPTDDSVDVAVGYMCIVGQRLMEVSPAGVHAVMERFRGLLHEGSVGKRGQYRIETLLKIRKGGFADYPSIEEELDLVEREDQITFEIGLDDDGLKKEESLDVFKFDEEYSEKEEEWATIRSEILGGDTDSGDGSGSDSGDESSEEENEIPDQVMPDSRKEDNKKTVVVQDLTETDLVHLRRTIYLTIMSSATFEECTHKLAKMDIPEGREHELINMIIECCSQERTFLRYYGLISGRFCLLHERWQDAFHEAFATQYNTIHRLETNKLRNVAKLFGHLLHTDSISWSVLSVIHLNEDETTSSSRIFIKILVQEIAEAMGMSTLKVRFDTDNSDPDGELAPSAESTALVPAKGNFGDKQSPVITREWFKGMFPKDNARNTRYAINFFTSIGLGPLTDGMREFLKNAPKLIMAQAQAEAAREAARKDSSDASSVLSSSSSSTSSFYSSSSSSSSSTASYTSSSSGSYSSDSGRRRKRGGGRGRNRKRRRSYSTSSSSSGSFSSSSSGYSSRDRKKTTSNSGRQNSRISRNLAINDELKDADKDSKADASSTRSVSLSGDRHRRRKRSSSRSKSRSVSHSRSRSLPSKSSKGKSHKGGISRESRRKKRSRSSSYSSSSSGSRSASRSPTPKKRRSEKNGR